MVHDLLCDEFGFVLDVRVFCAGLDEGGEIEAMIMDDFVDDMFGVVMIRRLMAYGTGS